VSGVHVKDALLADGSVRPAGEGDGQVGELLSELRASGYRGFLSLEPHLGGGASDMARAAAALRRLLQD
jgi:sugar phosphate isomerase/epimerase